MGRKEQRRGKGFEYKVVEIARKVGLSARRIPLSGGAQEKLDVEIAGIRFECKYRKNGFRELFSFQEKTRKHDGFGTFLGTYRREPLVVVPSKFFLLLLRISIENGLLDRAIEEYNGSKKV